MRGGRPLRFLLAVMAGWVGGRAVMLWPVDPIAAVERLVLPGAAAEPHRRRSPQSWNMPQAVTVWWPKPAAVDHDMVAGKGPFIPVGDAADQPIAAPATATTDAGQAGIIAGLPAAIPVNDAPPRSRWFGSGWAVMRGGTGAAGGIPGAQLGGSQAGFRLGYALTQNRRFAIVGRASSPIGKGMREVALGVEWQPTRLPVRVVAEQRFAIGQGRGGPTLALVGGVSGVALPIGFALEGYAQGGVIGRDGVEGYADGAVRAAHPVATLSGVRIDLGLGGWGAVQRGARRIDVGPSLSAVIPVGRQYVRLSLDWRQRIAGNASPDSGLVATLGADF